MDQFVSTYRRDYLWPYVRSFGKKLIEPSLDSAGFTKKCVCRCYPPTKHLHSHDDLGPTFESPQQDWSRNGPMGGLLDAKLYPVQAGKSPETNTVKDDQPNKFLKKLNEKYPFLNEILQTAPTAEILNKVNQDRLMSTYQVDYCRQEEYPPDAMLRESGGGTGPCSEPNRAPGDPYRPNQGDKSFKENLQHHSVKRKQCVTGPGQGGTSGKKSGEGGGDGEVSKWKPSNSEYQDGISKLGALIVKEKLHYHTPH